MFDAKAAYPDLSDKDVDRFNRFTEFLSKFNIELSNHSNKSGPLSGFVISQDNWFLMLDLCMVISMSLVSNNYQDITPILFDEITDYRPSIQDIHMEHIFDIILLTVGRTDEEFEKPYDLSSPSNDLIFHFRSKEILKRLMVIVDEYLDIIEN